MLIWFVVNWWTKSKEILLFEYLKYSQSERFINKASEFNETKTILLLSAKNLFAIKLYGNASKAIVIMFVKVIVETSNSKAWRNALKINKLLQSAKAV